MGTLRSAFDFFECTRWFGVCCALFSVVGAEIDEIFKKVSKII